MKAKFINTLYSLSLLLFITAFGFQHNPPSGWYQQFMPDLGGKQIIDIDFVDSLTGFAIASKSINPDTSIILKTNNGGDNWSIVFQEGRRRFSKVFFINENTGFVSGGTGSGTAYLYKTTDSGNSWFNISSNSCAYWDDMSVVNEDTIYTVDYDGFCGGVFLTTNGGTNWIRTANFGGLNPQKIYMYNGSLGFVSRGNHPLLRTTDGGFTWHEIESVGGFNHMIFVDSLMGWKMNIAERPHITTNGGLNWMSSNISGSNNPNIVRQYRDISMVNKDTLWLVGPGLKLSPNVYRGLLYISTNSGLDWGFQIPDSNINIDIYTTIDFVNSKKGWSYTSGGTGIHTIVGGNDTTFYTGIVSISNEVPSDFKLHQNYPNPFNPRTVIRYELTRSANVTLKVYDVTGRENTTLVNDFQRTGVYEVDFMGKFSASGVYFYRLSANGELIDTKKMLMIR